MKSNRNPVRKILAWLLALTLLLAVLPVNTLAVTGDANRDGVVNIWDLQALFQYLVGLFAGGDHTTDNGVIYNGEDPVMDIVSSDLSGDGVTDAGDIIPMLKIANSSQLQNVLRGKAIAFMGDSITTYRDWSNNATQFNSTIGNNRNYYGPGLHGVTTADDTYWKQLVDKYDMTLTCNNSISGSRIIGIGPDELESSQGFALRPTQLHDDTVSNNPDGKVINPDIVCVYLGTNDHLNYDEQTSVIGTFEEVDLFTLITSGSDGYIYAQPQSFAEAYCIMLHKIDVNYPNAEIFVMNLPLRTAEADPLIVSFNDVIAKAAANYGAHVVDLYSSILSGANYRSYSGDGVHPNAAGMDVMTEELEKAMDEVFLQQPEAEKEQLKTMLAGKKLSVMGDSISSYEGWSNNDVQYNSTLTDYHVYYRDGRFEGITVDDTYWKQLMDQMGMTLAVNNSFSGAPVVTANYKPYDGYDTRPYQLHDDTLSNNPNGQPVYPDVIVLYMGINDMVHNQSYPLGSFDTLDLNTLIQSNGNGGYTYQTPASFIEGYTIMVQKIRATYPDADLFLLNMPCRTAEGDPRWTQYNAIIADVAQYYGACVVDLGSSKMSGAQHINYTVGDNLHPNAVGMDVMTEELIQTMIRYYLK